MENLKPKILVTGATGYVGSRLVPRLLEAGFCVRACSRSLDKLKERSWSTHENIELAQLDVHDREMVDEAVAGCTHSYYLVHSMNPLHDDFAEADRQAATIFKEACDRHKLRQLIYLGGLGERSENLSKHLNSRAEVAEILAEGSTPLTVLRAAMIIGSGSASFEILRYLVDRLPVMITPRWVHTPSQPIAIRNVLHYLIACVDNVQTFGKSFDIGGPEQLAYKDLMMLYAQEAGLPPRLIIPVPVFTPRLSSYWIHLVTPVPAYIARPLAEGLRNPALCRNDEIRDLLPQKLLTCREAIALALNRVQYHGVESHWTDAGVFPPEWYSSDDPVWAGGTVLSDERRIVVNCGLSQAWQPITRIGGNTGYYCADWLWDLRGKLDRLVGGVGLRRGRRDPVQLRAGDALDFWRVKKVVANDSLLLVAEMKLPGHAILEFKLRSLGNGQTEITQKAKFLPSGIEGILYWYLVSPLHAIVFNGMLKGIARASGAEILEGPRKLSAAYA